MKYLHKAILLGCLGCWVCLPATYGQHSVARQWNEVLLEGIRRDGARPTVHARNLFHISAGMYDAWAAFDPVAQPYFLGQAVDNYIIPFEGMAIPTDVVTAQEEALSFAAYRLIRHRFANSPGRTRTWYLAELLMRALGYDFTFTGTNYLVDGPAALGNYLAEQIIAFGYQDGSNEWEDYANQYYQPSNDPLDLSRRGNVFLSDPNRWQPLWFIRFVGQGGTITIDNGTPPFLSPEWGNVTPFALTEADKTTYQRDGVSWHVYHDPGPPPYLEQDGGGLSAEYLWGFGLVGVWSTHIFVPDSVMWDISPASIGNVPIDQFPTSFEEMRDFYKLVEGGDIGQGHPINPHTGQPYEPQIVPRRDYARVLAEFWADGPDSETPPGHWFTILNYVNDQPELAKRFQGEGEPLSDLEWDVKAYFALGAAMHDAAISAWSVKGWYDYIRPVSVIRWSGTQGQSSDPHAAYYTAEGLPIMPGFIEVIGPEDERYRGDFDENVGKMKIGAMAYDPWDSSRIFSGIVADRWIPYQPSNFVTPPFAGYVSGHSTFSRAAAEVLTLLTGDPFFPGGMGTFPIEKDRFLKFEVGPSVDMELQWATYQDASDQTSLSRIWGGIHPPADDIPGRMIGYQVGIDAFQQATQYFEGAITQPNYQNLATLYPNPVSVGERISAFFTGLSPQTQVQIRLISTTGSIVLDRTQTSIGEDLYLKIPTEHLSPGVYLVEFTFGGQKRIEKFMVR